MSIIALDITTSPTDILLTDDLAIVAGDKEAALVNLTDLNAPKLAGILDGVGGRLALTESGLLLYSARSAFGGEEILGGLNTAALQSLVFISKVDPDPIELDRDSDIRQDVLLEFRALMEPDSIESGEIEIKINNQAAERLPTTIEGDRGRAVIPQGRAFPSKGVVKVKAFVNEESRTPLVSPERLVDIFKPRIAYLSFEYDHAPTFGDLGRTEPVLDKDGNFIRDPEDGPQGANARANAFEPLAASVRLILRDQRGQPFQEEDILILAENEELKVNDGDNVRTTDALGRADSRITVDSTKVSENGKVPVSDFAKPASKLM